MERLTKKFTDGNAYCEEIEDVGIKGINYPTYVGKAVDKLADYEELEEQGLLLRLPCKVGETVWYIGDDDSIYPVKIIEISILNSDMSYNGYFMKCTYEFDINDFGKTVFLTKEEAEQKLKEMENK